MLKQWTHLIRAIGNTEGLVYSGVRKIVADIKWSLPWEKLTSHKLKYPDLDYTLSKRSQLLRNYWDTEAVEAAMEKLMARRGKDHTSVSIQLKGQKKDPRSQGFCMQNLVITMTKEVVTVDIYYRSTELVQKFLADLIFFSEVLPPLFERLGKEPTVIRFTFANVYLSSVFMPIFCRLDSDPAEFFRTLQLNDPRFFRTCGLATSKFLKPDHNYTYRSRIKMFEYWKKHVSAEKVKAVTKLIGNLRGELPNEEITDDD